MIEKRSMERFNLDLEAIVTVLNGNQADQIIKLQTLDVCAGGAYIKTPLPLPVGTEVALKIILLCNFKTSEKQNRSLISAAGSVARIDEKGMAICFGKNVKISPYLAKVPLRNSRIGQTREVIEGEQIINQKL